MSYKYTTVFIGLLLYCLPLAGCCATRFANIQEVQKAKTYHELIDLLDYLDCYDVDLFKECLYSLNSFNVLTLERRDQIFRFTLNSRGQIIKKQLNEFSTSYHLLPPTELPDYVSEFR